MSFAELGTSQSGGPAPAMSPFTAPVLAHVISQGCGAPLSGAEMAQAFQHRRLWGPHWTRSIPGPSGHRLSHVGLG